MMLSFLILITAFPVTASAQADGFEPRLTSPDRSNPYYNSELNVYSQTGYGMPNCVAYVFGRIYEITGEEPLITRGSAGEWWSINKKNGYYAYGQEPKLGAVACWSNHVAVVEKIEATQLPRRSPTGAAGILIPLFLKAAQTVLARNFMVTFICARIISKNRNRKIQRRSKRAWPKKWKT